MPSFKGSFEINKPLSKEHYDYLVSFSKTRRVTRDTVELSKLEDPVRESVELPLGEEGCYYVGASKGYGMGTVIGYNDPPNNQPSVWCMWIPDDDGDRIVWNGNAKFDKYAEWIQYLISNLLQPWGYVLNGTVKWAGHGADVGKITIINNKVEIFSLAAFA